MFSDLVDRADVGMVEGRGSLCLALEPLQRLVIFDEPSGRNLSATKRRNLRSSAL